MYRTYSYNDMPIPVQRRNEDMRKPMPPPKKEIECKEEKIEKKCEKNEPRHAIRFFVIFLSGVA